MAKLVSFLILKEARVSTMKRMFMRLMSHKAQTKVNQEDLRPADVTLERHSHQLHVSAVLTANLKESVGNLTQ